MKTTITINGLHVEFTDEVPTGIGPYWWLHRDGLQYPEIRPVLKEIRNPCSDVLIDIQTDMQPQDVGGLWSAPLVPVTEIMNAHREGWHDRANMAYDNEDLAYHKSRAKRVVEGGE